MLYTPLNINHIASLIIITIVIYHTDTLEYIRIDMA